MSEVLTVVPLPTPRRFARGDDLGDAVVEAARAAGWRLRDGDVVSVASKVVSKVEGAEVALPPDADRRAARRQAALGEARRVVAAGHGVLVVETRHGFVCANAGIDASNVGEDATGRALRLPDDPDASAETLRHRLATLTGAEVGVLVTDTFGRPWRLGQTDVALGVAGLAALRDERGTVDLDGRELEVTVVAVADELAAAADAVRRKAGGVPFVLLRGADAVGQGRGRDLLRPADEDLFRWGGVTAVSEAVAATAAGHPAPTAVSADALETILEVAGRVPGAERVAVHRLDGLPARIAVDVHGDDRPAMLTAGAVVLALEAAAAAIGFAAETTPGEGRRAATVAIGPPGSASHSRVPERP